MGAALQNERMIAVRGPRHDRCATGNNKPTESDSNVCTVNAAVSVRFAQRLAFLP